MRVTIGQYSIIIVRDDDEGVRAFHNVCRHRGARILNEERGSVGNIVCGYHRWTYGMDGTLLHAESQPPDFDPSCFGLRPVHVRTLAGLVYICLAEEPPDDFDDVIARVEPYIAPHNLARAKVAQQIDLVENGNWKLTMENNRECYHCGGHPNSRPATSPPTATRSRTSRPCCAPPTNASSGPTPKHARRTSASAFPTPRSRNWTPAPPGSASSANPRPGR
ncbi:aromatic ring-hydroxylating dioxygenase subunit alpha [Streptomyces sp. M19]